MQNGLNSISLNWLRVFKCLKSVGPNSAKREGPAQKKICKANLMNYYVVNNDYVSLKRVRDHMLLV